MVSSDKLCLNPGFELQIAPTLTVQIPHEDHMTTSHLPQLPLRSKVSFFSPPLPPHLASKVLVSPRSLKVDCELQHLCDS